MPALALAPPGSIKVQLIGTNQGALFMNQLFFNTAGGAATPQDPTQITAFLTSISTAWGAQIAPLCNTSVSLTALVYTDLSASDGAQVTLNLATPIAGTRGAANLPVSVACVFSWRVANRYRGGHGRNYLPAGLLADITLGRTWAGAFVTSATNAAGTFHTTIDGLSIGTVQVDHTVLSYFSGSHKTPSEPHPAPVPRPTPLPMRVISAKVRTRVDTQRRRLGKETV